MHVGVKRTGRQLAATGVAGQPHLGRLFYIHDISSNTRFLVDTGAEVSVVPPFHTERSHQPSTFTLQAVNGSKITTFGVRSLTLNLERPDNVPANPWTVHSTGYFHWYNMFSTRPA